MNCPSPIDAALLADYWLAILDAAAEERIEEHLLACDPCSARLREIIALAAAVGNLARDGSLRMVVSDAFLDRLAGNGLRIRQYAPPPGGSVQCTVLPEDDVLIGRLAANLTGAARVDLSICDQSGVEQMRLPDIPVHPASGVIALQESITHAKGAPTSTLIMRLLSLDESGAESLLGEYTFHHTRSMPGPALPPA
jgi:hypothetical protein